MKRRDGWCGTVGPRCSWIRRARMRPSTRPSPRSPPTRRPDQYARDRRLQARGEQVLASSTTANLLTPDGPAEVSPATHGPGRPSRCAARAAMRTKAKFSAPSRQPEETKGSNHEPCCRRCARRPTCRISITYFGNGPIERFKADGDSVPTDWVTGQPDAKSAFYACSQIRSSTAG